MSHTEITVEPDSATNEPIKLNYFDCGKPGNVAVIVGGSGDSRDSLAPLAEAFAATDPDYDWVTFSFRGRETGNHYTLGQQCTDLEDVVDYLNTNGRTVTAIICTSQGAFS